jgi:TolB protein
MNVDGSGVKRLTTGPTDADIPTWSPDGGQITYVSGRDGHNEIYVMDRDGSHQKRLTHTASDNTWPFWEPNGK